MKEKRKGTRRGFTLVEVLIALAILGIGILGVTLLFPVALRESRLASGSTVAAVYADSVVDVLRAQDYDALAILTRADYIYNLYSEPVVRVVPVFELINGANDLYSVVFINVPLHDVRTERYVTYIARQ